MSQVKSYKCIKSIHDSTLTSSSFITKPTGINKDEFYKIRKQNKKKKLYRVFLNEGGHKDISHKRFSEHFIEDIAEKRNKLLDKIFNENEKTQ